MARKNQIPRRSLRTKRMKRTKRMNKRSNTKKRTKRTKRMRRKRSQNKIGGADARDAPSADESLPPIHPARQALKARVWEMRADNPDVWTKKLVGKMMEEIPALVTPTVDAHAAKAHIQRLLEEYDRASALKADAARGDRTIIWQQRRGALADMPDVDVPDAMQEKETKRLNALRYIKNTYIDDSSGESVIEWTQQAESEARTDHKILQSMRKDATEPSADLKLRFQVLVDGGLVLKREIRQMGRPHLIHGALVGADRRGISYENLREGFEVDGEPISDETSNLLMMLADRDGNDFVSPQEFTDFMWMWQRLKEKRGEFAPSKAKVAAKRARVQAQQQVRLAEAAARHEKGKKSQEKYAEKAAAAMAELQDAMAVEKR